MTRTVHRKPRRLGKRGLDQAGSSTSGATLGLTMRPLIEALMQLARNLRQNALAVLRVWIRRHWH